MADIGISVGIESKGLQDGEQRVVRALVRIRQEAQKTDIQGLGKLDSSINRLAASINTTNSKLNSLGSTVEKTGKQIKTAHGSTSKYADLLLAMQKSTRLTDGALGGVATRFETLNSVVRSGVPGLFAWVAGITLFSGAIAIAVREGEKFTKLTNQLKLVTTSTANLTVVTKELFKIAVNTRSTIDGTVNLYARLARSTDGVGISQGKLLVLTKAINQAVTLSATTTASAEAALFQFGQGLSSNALRGQELNSVMEQTPRLLRDIVDGLNATGVTVNGNIGSLRKLAEQGKLSAKILADAIASQAQVLSDEFGTATITINQALGNFSTRLTELIGGASASTRATRLLAQAIDYLARNLDTILNVALLGVAASMIALTPLMGALAAGLKALAVAATIAEANVVFLSVASQGFFAAITAFVLANPIGILVSVIGLAAAGLLAWKAGQASFLDSLNDTNIKTQESILLYQQANALSGERADALRSEADAQRDSTLAMIDGLRELKRIEIAATRNKLTPPSVDWAEAIAFSGDIGGMSMFATTIGLTESEAAKLTKTLKAQENQLKDLDDSYQTLIKETARASAGIKTLSEVMVDATEAQKDLERIVESTLTPEEKLQKNIEYINKIKETYKAAHKELSAVEEEAMRRFIANSEKAVEDSKKKVEAIVSPMTKVLEDTASSIRSSFKATFKDIFSDGTISFKKLTDRIKDLFVDMLADMAVLAISKPIIVPIIQHLGGFLGVPQGDVANLTKQFGGGDSGGSSPLTSALANGIGKFASTTNFLGNLSGFSYGLGGFGGIPAGGFAGATGVAGLGGTATGAAATTAAATSAASIAAIALPIAVIAIPLLLSAFKKQGTKASEFTGTTTGAGFTFGVGSKRADTEFASGLGKALNGITKALTELDIDVSGLKIRGGFNTKQAGGGFFDLGLAGQTDAEVAKNRILFNAKDEEEMSSALAKITLKIAQMGTTINEDIITALQNVQTEGRKFEEVLSDLSFASTYSKLSFIPEEISDLDAALRQLSETTKTLTERATSLGLDTDVVSKAATAYTDKLRTDFDDAIGAALLQIEDPIAAALAESAKKIAKLVADAILIGGDVSQIERLGELDRQRIIGINAPAGGDMAARKAAFDEALLTSMLEAEDPIAAALKASIKETAKLRAEAILVGGNILLVERLGMMDRRKIIEDGTKGIVEATKQQMDDLKNTLTDRLKAISTFRDALALDKTLGGVNRLGRLQEATRQFEVIKSRVASGDATALADIDKSSTAYLEASLDYFGQTSEYLSNLDAVKNLLKDAEGLAKQDFDVVTLQLVEAQKQTGLLSKIAEQLNASALEEAFASAGVKTGQTLRQGEAVDSLRGKINTLNKLPEETVRKLKVLASGGEFDFSSSSQSFAGFVKTGHRAAGSTFLDLLRAQGVSEEDVTKQSKFFGFASGTGNSTFSGSALVGERGAELVNFGRPAQIINANGTSSLMAVGDLAGDFKAYRSQSAQETIFLGEKLEDLTQIMVKIADDLAVASRSGQAG
ncbi:MAG: hypothetical protein A2Y53_05650 [Chloroflexi bacterium RBG_16_47_49]|nr:MAG: hypothetical protein A2Y53_05650 [Chloroflexi bacterium RBG_16_47_49]